MYFSEQTERARVYNKSPLNSRELSLLQNANAAAVVALSPLAARKKYNT